MPLSASLPPWSLTLCHPLLAAMLLWPRQEEPKPATPPAPGSSESTDDADAPKLHRLWLEWGPLPPALVEIESSMTSDITVALAGAPPVEKQKETMSRRFVDEVVGSGDDMTASRRFVRCQFDEDGAVDDPPYVGETFELRSVGENVELRSRAGRRLHRRTFEVLQVQLQAPALWLPLVEECAVGDEFDCEPTAFLQLLLELEGTIESCGAKLKLDAVDEEKGLATLRGTATAVEKLSDPVEAIGRWACDLEITVDLAAHRVAAVACSGTVKGSAKVRGIDTSVTGAFRHDAKVTVGAAATAALTEQSTPRDRRFNAHAANVSLALSSQFEEMQFEPECIYQFASGDEQLSVALQAFPHRSPKPADAVSSTIDAARKALAGDPKVKDVKSALGSGKAISYEVEATTIDVEFYPLGKDQLLRLRFIGTPAMRKRFEKDIARVRATLKPLAP